MRGAQRTEVLPICYGGCVQGSEGAGLYSAAENIRRWVLSRQVSLQLQRGLEPRVPAGNDLATGPEESAPAVLRAKETGRPAGVAYRRAGSDQVESEHVDGDEGVGVCLFLTWIGVHLPLN